MERRRNRRKRKRGERGERGEKERGKRGTNFSPSNQSNYLADKEAQVELPNDFHMLEIFFREDLQQLLRDVSISIQTHFL
jgi:hypothetical protein